MNSFNFILPFIVRLLNWQREQNVLMLIYRNLKKCTEKNRQNKEHGSIKQNLGFTFFLPRNRG